MPNNEANILLSLDNEQFATQIKASISDSKNFTAATKEAQESLKNLSAAPAAGSVADLTKRLNDAKSQLNNSIPASREYENALKRIAVLSNLLGTAQETASAKIKETARNYTSATTSIKTGSSSAGNSLMQIGRIVQDAPYGFMGMANNIQFASESFIMLARDSGGAKAALSSLASAFMGPMGIMFAISAVTSAFTYYSMHTRGAKKDTDDLKKSADALKDSLKTMSRDTMTSLIMAEEAVIRGIEALGNSKVKKTKYDPGINRNIEYEENRGLTSAEQEKLDAAKQNLNLLRAELNSLGLIENQRRKVNELEKAWVNARTTSEKDAAKIVYDNAQKELEQIEGKKEKAKELIDNEYELRKVKYELGLISLEEYRSFLKERIASVKQSTKEELELYKSYKEDLKNLDESTRVKGLDIVFENARQEKAFNLIKDNYERRGIVWDENAKAFALRMAMDIKDDPMNVPNQMKPLTGIDRGTMDEPIKLTKDEAEKLSFTVNAVSQVFSELGNSIAEAMFGAKKSIGEVIVELTKLIAKIFIMKGIELLASAAMDVIFPGSGTAARAGFAVASGASGGLKKSVLNKEVYSSKFDTSSAVTLNPTFLFENTIDTQEIVYKGIQKIQDLHR
jgi:hypothetical protein